MELIVQLQELRWALQALAQPARVQLSLFPDFVCKADELAPDFDSWRLAVLGNPSSRLTDEQRAALQQVDAVLEAMSGSDNPFWDEEALSKSAEWDRVRQLAVRALEVFGWPSDVPPKDRAVYVPAGRRCFHAGRGFHFVARSDAEPFRRLIRFGGVAFIVCSAAHLAFGILERLAGPPPPNGREILAWVEASRFALSLNAEVLFVATVALVAGLLPLYRSIAKVHLVKAALACSVLGLVAALLAALTVILGRLVFPVFGISVSAPDTAELVVGLFYGGMHAVDLLWVVAIVVLSVAIKNERHGLVFATLGGVAASGELAVAYPYLLGPTLTVACRVPLAVWLVAMGVRLVRWEVVAAHGTQAETREARGEA